MLEIKLKNLRSWFVEKSRLIERYFQQPKKGRRLICKMGDIYYARIGVNVGFEIDKHRPVVIFQGYDLRLRNADLVFIFPLTSNTKLGDDRVMFQTKDLESGSTQEGAILVYQGRALSKTRLVRYLGNFRQSKLSEIKEVLENMLYKNTPLEREAPGGHTDVPIARDRD